MAYKYKQLGLWNLKEELTAASQSGDLRGLMCNSLELPDHFLGIVKHIKGVTFGICPECLAKAGYGSRWKSEPTEEMPHHDQFDPNSYIDAAYTMLGRMCYASQEEKNSTQGLDLGDAYKRSPKGSVPTPATLPQCPIVFVLGRAVRWPQGMIQHLGHDELPDPNLNLCVLCPEHGSVWASISPQLCNIMLMVAGAGGGKMNSQPPALTEEEMAAAIRDNDCDRYEYDPDADLDFLRTLLKVEDRRDEDEAAQTVGFVSAEKKNAAPDEPGSLLLLPFVDECDELNVTTYIKKGRPELNQLKTFKAKDWESDSIPLGRVIRKGIEIGALGQNDSIRILSRSVRLEWESRHES